MLVRANKREWKMQDVHRGWGVLLGLWAMGKEGNSEDSECMGGRTCMIVWAVQTRVLCTESAYETAMKGVRTKKNDDTHELPCGRAETRQHRVEDRPEDGEGGKERSNQKGCHIDLF